MLRAFVIGVLLSPLLIIALALLGNFPEFFRWLAIAALVVLVLLLCAGLYAWVTGQAEDKPQE